MERYEEIMRSALALAERGWGRVSPNPMVGAVVLTPGDEVLSEGWHEGPGTPHAEVMALTGAGASARGSTVVVTLEPCDRWGRTPPCTAALIDAGVRRVVVAATDPNLDGGGSGLDALRVAGLEVEVGICEQEARRLNVAYETHLRTGRPFVIVKSAATLDGKTAAVDGTSRWITSEPARRDAHRLRAWADAVIVGSRTAIADDPALTVRHAHLTEARQPLRVLVDATGTAPASGRIFDGEAPTLVATTDRAPEFRIEEWEAAGAEVAVMERDPAGEVSLAASLAYLGKRDVQGVLVEGGATLIWSFVRDGLVDRFVVYVAPKILGGAAAPGIAMGAGFSPVGEALPLSFERVERVGHDLRVEADVHRDR